MWDAWLLILLSFVTAAGCSILCSFFIVGGLWRRCTKLEWAVGDLQQRASSFKGKEMANKRWEKNAAFEAEMEQALKGAAPARQRYDNDPLGN
jgi:hypothetical protein